MAARPLDFGPILREIRLQERDWARGKFEMSETNPNVPYRKCYYVDSHEREDVIQY